MHLVPGYRMLQDFRLVEVAACQIADSCLFNPGCYLSQFDVLAFLLAACYCIVMKNRLAQVQHGC